MNPRPSAYDPGPAAAENEPPAPWGQAALAALTVLLPGLALALTELPALAPRWLALHLGTYLFVLAGLLAGWLRGFPRWSLPYLGHGLLYALFLSDLSMRGLKLLGQPIGQNGEWAWRAWLGLGAVAAVTLAVTRSLRPLAGLFAAIWRDGTRLSLALYGTLPLVLWVLFDEVHQPYPVPFLTVSALCLAAGAVAHTRSDAAAQCMLSLLAGLTAAWLVSTAALTACWTAHPFTAGQPPSSWPENVWPMALAWAVVVGVLLLPELASRLLRARRLRAA